VPGGWAAQVRNWVLDVSLTGGELVPDAFGLHDAEARQRRRQRRRLGEGDDGVEMVVRSVETAGAGGGVGVVGVVTGELVGRGTERAVNVVLVGGGGDGGANARGRSAGIARIGGQGSDGLKEGDVIVLGLPAWEVDVNVLERRGRPASEEPEEQEPEEQEQQQEEEKKRKERNERDRQNWVVCPVWRTK